jgi:hypothetical protein
MTEGRRLTFIKQQRLANAAIEWPDKWAHRPVKAKAHGRGRLATT